MIMIRTQRKRVGASEESLHKHGTMGDSEGAPHSQDCHSRTQISFVYRSKLPLGAYVRLRSIYGQADMGRASFHILSLVS
jgi:hypothetical protein